MNEISPILQKYIRKGKQHNCKQIIGNKIMFCVFAYFTYFGFILIIKLGQRNVLPKSNKIYAYKSPEGNLKQNFYIFVKL